jgi:hypothetical protein
MFGLKEKKEWPSQDIYRTCENCIHAALVIAERTSRATHDEFDVTWLQCRRLPPVVPDPSIEYAHRWPLVLKEDWCQEHEEPENTHRWEPRRAVYNQGYWPPEDR